MEANVREVLKSYVYGFLNYEIPYVDGQPDVDSIPEKGTPPDLTGHTQYDFIQFIVDYMDLDEDVAKLDVLDTIKFVCDTTLEQFHSILKNIVIEDEMEWDTVIEVK
jgi:hypothetical protein